VRVKFFDIIVATSETQRSQEDLDFISTFVSEVERAESFYVHQTELLADRFERLKLQVLALVIFLIRAMSLIV